MSPNPGPPSTSDQPPVSRGSVVFQFQSETLSRGSPAWTITTFICA